MKLDNICVNSLRALSMDMINNAKSGHSGIALGAAPILYSLYANILNTSPKDPKNIFRDRFVMSAGHGSALLYATLHSLGFGYSMDDLKKFRSIDAKCAGHPEAEHNNPIDASTGPLGQGVANAVGMAMAERHMSSLFNKPEFKLFDNYTYCLVGDGCLMEGVANEALSLAGSLKLNKLIVVYDFNKISLDGKIDVAFKQNTKQVFLGYGFNVIEVKDGNNVSKITKAINKAKKSLKPTLVIVNTVIGYGSHLADNHKSHGAVLGESETENLKKFLQLTQKPFTIAPRVKDLFSQSAARYSEVKLGFDQKLKEYHKNYPSDYKTFQLYMKNDFSDIDKYLSELENKQLSTREASGEILNLIGDNYPNVLGGCADVLSSTKAKVYSDFFNTIGAGRNIMFGVREFAMSAITNGISLYGGLVPFSSTFLVFADYLKAGIRLSALSKLKSIYILTHDSIMVGKDGPTHQPVEQVAMFRATPNTYVFRPCDYTETAASYAVAYNKMAPSALILTRQTLKPQSSSFKNAKLGAYIIKANEKPLKAILIATGSEVELAINVAAELEASGVGVRVVSMPCMELFDEQPQTYKDKVLDKSVATFAIEFSSDQSFYKYISKGQVIGVNQFGYSADPQDIIDKLKLDVKSVVSKVKEGLK